MQRVSDNFLETLEMNLPGLVTVTTGRHAPGMCRWAASRRRSAKADIVSLDAATIGLDPERMVRRVPVHQRSSTSSHPGGEGKHRPDRDAAQKGSWSSSSNGSATESAARSEQDLKTGQANKMTAKRRQIWIFGDHRNYFQNRVTLQLLSRAKDLAQKIDAEICAVVFGHSVDEWVQEYIAHGAEKIYRTDDPRLAPTAWRPTRS